MPHVCLRCGADLSHRKKAIYCRRDDGDGTCFNERNCEEEKRRTRKRAEAMNKKCKVCGKPVKSPERKTCSRECAGILRSNIHPEYSDQKMIHGYLDWPYKLPMDESVTPSMMNPMGSI